MGSSGDFQVERITHDQSQLTRSTNVVGPTDRSGAFDPALETCINCYWERVTCELVADMLKSLAVFFLLVLQGLLAFGFTNPIKKTDGSDPFMVSLPTTFGMPYIDLFPPSLRCTMRATTVSANTGVVSTPTNLREDLTTTTWTNIQITRATTINGLKTATPKVIWQDSTSSRCCNLCTFI